MRPSFKLSDFTGFKKPAKSGYVFPGRGLLRGKLAFSKKAGFPLNGSYLLEKAYEKGL